MADEIKKEDQEKKEFVPTWVTIIALAVTMVVVLAVILKI
jgi:hypothetical protein